MRSLFSYDWAHPWCFLLFIPLLWLAYRTFASKEKNKLTPTLKMSHLGGPKMPISFRARLIPYLPILIYAAATCIIFALARPRIPLVDEAIKTEGIDIMLALDVSASMLSRDFQPNRLEATKLLAADFVRQRQNDRIGLVIYSGESFAQCPITFDHEVLTSIIESIEPGILKDGTAIGMGLASAVNRLKESKAKSGIIILMTDGENNSGDIDPMTAAELAKEYDIKVYTIGIGTTGVAETFQGVDRYGEYIYGMARVQIDEELLDRIARRTDGQYYRATNEENLKNIYAEINRLEKSAIDTNITKQYKDTFRPWLLASVILMMLWWILSLTYFRNNTLI